MFALVISNKAAHNGFRCVLPPCYLSGQGLLEQFPGLFIYSWSYQLSIGPALGFEPGSCHILVLADDNTRILFVGFVAWQI